MLAVVDPVSQLEVELAEAEDAAANGRADELDVLWLLELSESFYRVGRKGDAFRCDVLAGRAVWAGATEDP